MSMRIGVLIAREEGRHSIGSGGRRAWEGIRGRCYQNSTPPSIGSDWISKNNRYCRIIERFLHCALDMLILREVNGMDIVSQGRRAFTGELCESLLEVGGRVRHREFRPRARNSRIASGSGPGPEPGPASAAAAAAAAVATVGEFARRCGSAPVRSAGRGTKSEQAGTPQ